LALQKTENLSKKSISETVAIKAFKIGNYTFKDLTVLIANDTQGVSAYDGYLGVLGANIIKRFSAILDYTTKTLYLKPNSNFDSKFNFPVSGLRIKQLERHIRMEQVETTSDAYKSGIREGDKIISINEDVSLDLRTYRKFKTRR
jgi:C-terminal processing protease CtpA/Prc